MSKRQEIKALKKIISHQTHDIDNQAQNIAKRKLHYALGGAVIGGPLIMASLIASPGITASVLTLGGAGIMKGSELLAEMKTANDSKNIADDSKKRDVNKIHLTKLEDAVNLAPTPGLLPRLRQHFLSLS